ncbi:MAG: polysaccharide biosynthesis/export family protein [Bacteroidales bacterium]|nr:polysaccharide biosynthesis/export family protein [Bacteroidales bacterium]
MKKKYYILFLFIVIFIFPSCKVFNPTRMLRMGSFPEYSDINLIKGEQLYRIAPFDELAFSMLPNDGEQMISGTNQTNSNSNMGGSGYKVEYDGTIKFPIFGRTKVSGMTTRELEQLLEEKYALLYNNPFITTIEVTNRKVIVFRGGNSSSVVSLTHDNMTIWELIAQTGGVGDAKAHKIKLIRYIDDQPHIFLIDLSKLESIETGNIVLQSDDIIYITPRNKFSEEIMFAVTPYLSLFSTLVLIYSIFR